VRKAVRRRPMVTKVATWARGGGRRAAGRGQWRCARAGAGVCAAVVWHWPRGRERVTELRSIVPTATASDWRSLRGLGVRACMYCDEG
jgi:hypothetical protein